MSDLPGLFMSPTVLSNIRPEMRAAREEIFGPVISVITFETTDDEVRIANDTSYGLSAAVWSARLDRCLSIGRRIRAGTVWINTFLDGTPDFAIWRLPGEWIRSRTRASCSGGLY